jgi:hypothetical protein
MQQHQWVVQTAATATRQSVTMQAMHGSCAQLHSADSLLPLAAIPHTDRVAIHLQKHMKHCLSHIALIYVNNKKILLGQVQSAACKVLLSLCSHDGVATSHLPHVVLWSLSCDDPHAAGLSQLSVWLCCAD